MPRLFVKYNLSKRYTNYCVRVTSTRTLDDSNFEGRRIIRVTGQKNVKSVKSYARKLSASKKRKISSTLLEAVRNVSEAGHEIENEDPNQFQLQPFDNQELDNLFSSTLFDNLLGVNSQAPLQPYVSATQLMQFTPSLTLFRPRGL